MRPLCALFAVLLFGGGLHAQAFTLSPDTIQFYPQNQTSMSNYVRVAYAVDSTHGPGTPVHATVTSGSAYFSTSRDTVLVNSRHYWLITYTVQSSTVSGTVTFTDDTTTRTVVLIGHPNSQSSEDGVMTANFDQGSYFSGTPPGTERCLPLRLINTGSDVDTIVSIAWAHDPDSIFSMSAQGFSTPSTLAAHDTDILDVCFHSPRNNNTYFIDTVVIHYHDAQSQTRTIYRYVTGVAGADSSAVTCAYLFAGTIPVTDSGHTSHFPLIIRNRLSASTTVTKLELSGDHPGSFGLDTSAGLPITLASGKADTIWMSFTPNATRSSPFSPLNATLTAFFTSSDTSHCLLGSLALSGTVAQPASDTERVNLNDTTSNRLSLTSDSGRYYIHRVEFRNNSNRTMRITSVSWTHSSQHFLISQIIPPLPDTLAPGDSFAVVIHFYGDSVGGSYHDTLSLTIDESLMNYLLYVDGYSYSAPLGVRTTLPTTEAALTIYPNPGRGAMTIGLEGADALSEVKYEVYDVLGNVVTTHGGPGDWQWNNGSAATPGTYFVRVTGRDANGNPVTQTRRIVVER